MTEPRWMISQGGMRGSRQPQTFRVCWDCGQPFRKGEQYGKGDYSFAAKAFRWHHRKCWEATQKEGR